MNFKWKNLPDTKDCVSFRINIDTGYKWGDGWKGERENAMLYNEELRDVLVDMNFDYHPGDSYGGCATVGKKGNALYAYLHPMEWTGAGPKKEVERLVSALSHMKSVRGKSSLKTEPAYDMRPWEIDKLLNDNNLEIMGYIDSTYTPLKFSADYGFDFAKEYRPNFVSDGGCFVGTNRDCVVNYVSNLAITYRNLLNAGIISKGDIEAALENSEKERINSDVSEDMEK